MKLPKEPAISISGASIVYRQWGTEVHALRDVSLEIGDGTWSLLVGHNGSGKSTLLGTISGSCELQAGAISLFGEPMSALSKSKKASLISMVHQRPEEGLGIGMTIAEHAIACGISPTKFFERLQKFKLDDAFPFLEAAWNRPIESLSGGERQILGIVLQLIRCSPILLLDEVFSALDPERERLIVEAVRISSQSSTVLQVTHQPERLLRLADNLVTLKSGSVVSVEEIDHES